MNRQAWAPPAPGAADRAERKPAARGESGGAAVARAKAMQGPGTYDAEAVVRAAFALFRQRGYEATSVDLIAKDLGITKASIYHHVAGKEAILSVGVTRAMDSLLCVLDEPPARPGGGTPLERFLHILRRSVEVEIDNLDEVAVLLRLKGNTPIERDALRRRRKFDRAVTAIVSEAVAAGEVREDVDPRLVTKLVFGMANWLTEWYRPGGSMRSDQVVSAVTGLVLSGIVVD